MATAAERGLRDWAEAAGVEPRRRALVERRYSKVYNDNNNNSCFETEPEPSRSSRRLLALLSVWPSKAMFYDATAICTGRHAAQRTLNARSPP